MGAINYGQGEFLTLGIEPFDMDDLIIDDDIITDLSLENLSQYEKQERILEYIQELYNDDYNMFDNVIKKYTFNHFELRLEHGYYEGFYLPINGTGYQYFDDYKEKQEALKETTILKKCLLECADYGIIRVSPGWITRYYTRLETISAINNAISEIKKQIKDTPTYRHFTTTNYKCNA